MDDGSPVFWAAFGGGFGGGAAAGIFTLIAVLLAEWLRWFIDRPLLKVSAHPGYLVQPLQRDETLYVFLKATNPHAKSVTVSTFGFYVKSKGLETLYVMPQQGYRFPYEIKGGTSLSQWTPAPELLTQLRSMGRKPSDLKSVWFESSAGKVFRSRIDKKTISTLEKLFATYRSSEAQTKITQ